MEERRCLRCGAPYEEGATVCFTCGASIGELETPTQPVRAPKRPVASEAVNEAAPSESPAPQQPVATATQSAPKPLTVGSSYQSMRPAPQPTPRPIRWPLLLAALAVVIALVIGGAYELRALTATPPIPKTTTYHDPQQRFSLAEPALWTLTPRDNGVLLSDSSGDNTVTITLASAHAGQTAAAIADAQAAQQGLQAAPAVSIGEDQWEQRIGSVTGADGATRVVTLYVDVHASTLYTIQTSSPSSVATSENTLVYQPLLASFSFS